MNKYLLFLLMFFVNFCFSQKKYSFNLISVYVIETDKNSSNQIIFTDTINNSYKFRLTQKSNNFLPNLYNIETREYLYFETIKKTNYQKLIFWRI